MSPSSTYMYQGSPTPRGIIKGCRVILVEMKYFKEDIIGECIDCHLRVIYVTSDQSAVVVNIQAMTLKKTNTNFEVLLHAGLLPRDLQNARDHPS